MTHLLEIILIAVDHAPYIIFVVCPKQAQANHFNSQFVPTRNAPLFVSALINLANKTPDCLTKKI